MKLELSAARKVAIAFAVALAISLGLGFMSYYVARNFVESAETVARTHRNLSLLHDLLATTVSAESEVRGYIITANEDFLPLYEASVQGVESIGDELRRSIRDPQARDALARLEKLTADRLERLELTLETRRSRGLDAVREISGPGKDLMDEVRSVATEIETRQLDLLKERERWAGIMTRRTIWTVIASAVVAVIVAAASVVILTADVAHRERMEREVLDISERERRRIGQDLHDGICQQLTGIALLSRGLQHRLEGESLAEAGRVTDLINDCIEQTRLVTRGLHPVPAEPSGLELALEDLAKNVNAVSKVKCRFDCPTPVPIPDQDVATNLFRIAQEAVQNALRHAEAGTIVIALDGGENEIRLSISDDGCGLPAHRTRPGLGLEIMSYRAHAVGARFSVEPREPRGTTVTCTLPRSSFY